MARTVLACVALALTSGAAQAKKPHFVFILVDDLGWRDVGAFNPETFYETPNVDRLAREGLRFTDGYAAGTCCSPTRFSIMTGKYPTRAGCTNAFSGKRAGKFLPAPLNNRMPLEEFTLAEALKEAGYKTAHVGKWHLGPTEEYWPEKQGFDVNVGGFHSGSPPNGYFAPWTNPRLPSGPKGEFLTERLTREAVNFIEKHKDESFFLHLAFHMVHVPLQAPKELVAKYEAKAAKLDRSGADFVEDEQVLPLAEPRQVRVRQNHAVYAAMVESMDTNVGRVLDALKRFGIDDNTVIFFMSDNGGLSTSEGLPTSNLPLRCGKGWVYEGGIRTPWIVKWPGVTRPGTVCDTPVITTDVYPTMFDIAALPARPKQHLDGVSLAPLLKGHRIAARSLYWHYPHYSNQGGFPGGALRDGDWKLIERYEDGQVHLYNLAEDLGERQDRAKDFPDRVRDMRGRLHAWYKEVGAKFLEPKENGPKPWQPGQ